MFSAGKIKLSGDRLYIVGDENDGGGTYGYYNEVGVGTNGSCTPSTFKGVNITALAFFGNDNFKVWMEGNIVQDFFISVYPQDSSLLATADATYSYNGTFDFTEWDWSGTSQPSSWDGVGEQTVFIR